MPTIEIPEIKISKTTLNGYLTTGMFICTCLIADKTLPIKLTAGAAVVLGFLRIVSGHLQQDAGTQLAITPDSPTPKLVPAVEVPVDPSAIPVVKS